MEKRWTAGLLRSAVARVLALMCIGPLCAEPLPVSVAFKAASIRSMSLSPDGRHAIALAGQKDWTTVVMIDTQTLASRVFGKPARGRAAPRSAQWVTDRVLAIGERNGTHFVDLAGETVHWTYGRFYRSLYLNERGEEIVLVKRSGNKYYYDRLNLRTGESELTNFNIPGEPLQWIFDRRGVARVVTTYSTAFWGDDTTVTHWYRATESQAWRRLADFPLLAVGWMPAFLLQDDRFIAVSSSEGRDTQAFFRYDVIEGSLKEMMAGHPQEDIVVLPRSDDDFPLVVTEGLVPRLHWFDAQWARLQQAVDRALPQRMNLLSGQVDGKVLVLSTGDVEQGQYFLLDAPGMQMQALGSTHPDIDAAQMRPKRAVTYPSSDGQQIPAYLTLPAGPDRNLPAVLLIHGGPVARDGWFFDPEVQMLAARGYAVLQPQFRGSSGFGKRFMEMGYGQWGLAMQDDVTAGALWLIEQGIADPQRLCVYGASYGGYASLWALVKTPELFRCGISFAGVSDLNFMFKDDSDRNESPIARLHMRAWVGDPRSKSQQLAAVSPLARAQDFRVPVLIAHGTLDERVPIEHSLKMVAALERQHKDVQWLPLEGEAHGFSEWETLETFYGALFTFLDRHIGRRGAPAVDAAKP
jgi:dipeptidyl aminopeptidase/acylaminoacyl peptidase